MTNSHDILKCFDLSLNQFLGVFKYVVVMPNFFEEIKAAQWPLAFLTYSLRNLPLVVGCIIFDQTCWYGPKEFLGVLKIAGGNARFF